jgi:two-component system phosphate regulon response regulator PhoB
MHDLLATGEGYEVVSSSHWIQSYEFIKDSQPDLVILDLMMGREQTGWAVLQLLQEDPSTAHIPVILCSAAEPALRQHACRVNDKAMVEAIAKPFDVDQLLEVIARLLEERSRKKLPTSIRPPRGRTSAPRTRWRWSPGRP